MREGRDLLDERALRQLLDVAAEEIPLVTDDDLARAARAAATHDREPVLQLGGRRGSARRSRPPARWALALAATLALTLAGGIGIGRNLAPAAESAPAPVLPDVAPAFRDAPGWSVVDRGIDVPLGTQAVIAANLPLDTHGEPLELAPQSVLSELPPEGVLVAVAGRAAAGAHGEAAAPGFDLADAAPETRWVGPQGGERALAEYALGATSGGLDLDVRVYLGSAEPTARQLAAAQAQLDRLVVRTAANQVTISARPTLVRWGEPVALSGAVSAGRAGERVMIEVRECGTSYWRAHDAATTTSGGQWFSETSVGISGAIRARWGDVASAPVAVNTRPGLIVNMLSGPRIRVSVTGLRSFYGRPIVMQRFDAPRQRWVDVARGRVAESAGAGNYIWGQAWFPARLFTRGTLYRAVMTNQQTGSCYLAAFSNMVRR